VAIVTLTTDFGTADGYVGAVKGVVLAHAPDAVLVDIAHDIPRYDIAAGAFALAQAAPHFPAGTIHLVVVDPGVGGARRPVIVDSGSQLFVAPDNGVLGLAVPQPRAAYAITADAFSAEKPSSTFHGRDLFAVAAGRLASGARPGQAGPPVALAGELRLEGEHRGEGGRLFARVIHVDAFGNLITDLRGDKVPPDAVFRVRGLAIPALSSTYENVAKGELLAYVGSGGTLEIASRERSAADDLDMGRGDAVEVLAPDPA
jgi:S-adenosylmethionine hydrolase